MAFYREKKGEGEGHEKGERWSLCRHETMMEIASPFSQAGLSPLNQTLPFFSHLFSLLTNFFLQLKLRPASLFWSSHHRWAPSTTHLPLLTRSPKKYGASLLSYCRHKHTPKKAHMGKARLAVRQPMSLKF